MFQVVLHQPEIPPNTGNIIRLCANTGTGLHLIHPLGFTMDDTRLARAGLDYREYVQVVEHDTYKDFVDSVQPPRVFALTVGAECRYTEVGFARGDALLFGKESTGLGQEILAHPSVVQAIRIPMLANRRSLNLANSVAIVLFEAWRQLGFPRAV